MKEVNLRAEIGKKNGQWACRGGPKVNHVTYMGRVYTRAFFKNNSNRRIGMIRKRRNNHWSEKLRNLHGAWWFRFWVPRCMDSCWRKIRAPRSLSLSLSPGPAGGSVRMIAIRKGYSIRFHTNQKKRTPPWSRSLCIHRGIPTWEERDG